jgi:hypothetical protein
MRHHVAFHILFESSGAVQLDSSVFVEFPPIFVALGSQRKEAKKRKKKRTVQLHHLK